MLLQPLCSKIFCDKIMAKQGLNFIGEDGGFGSIRLMETSLWLRPILGSS